MKTNLNALEIAILNEIAESNSKQYPLLKNHLNYIRVKSREYTGVGAYVSFDYLSKYQKSIIINEEHLVLSSEKMLEINLLQYGLNYEINITNGKIDFLEIATNGEPWDGDFGEFRFVN